MGDHYLINLYGCNPLRLDDQSFIRETLELACHTGKLNILNMMLHKFEPQGVTAIALLSESHISIHTWPENKTAACDVYTCGETAEPQLVVEYLKEIFGAEESKVEYIKR